MAHIIIIGSGIAGLFAALKIADSGNQVTVITKQRLKDSSTNWAQGGIAGILDKTDLEGSAPSIISGAISPNWTFTTTKAAMDKPIRVAKLRLITPIHRRL